MEILNFLGNFFKFQKKRERQVREVRYTRERSVSSANQNVPFVTVGDCAMMEEQFLDSDFSRVQIIHAFSNSCLQISKTTNFVHK